MDKPTHSREPALVHPHHVRAGVIALDALAGAAVGATAGIVAGPPGILAGAIIGGAVAAATGTAVETDHDRADRDEELDRQIGVSGGDIGAAPPDAPASVRGVFHGSSLGIPGSPGASPAEGPIQNLDSE